MRADLTKKRNYVVLQGAVGYRKDFTSKKGNAGTYLSIAFGWNKTSKNEWYKTYAYKEAHALINDLEVQPGDVIKVAGFLRCNEEGEISIRITHVRMIHKKLSNMYPKSPCHEPSYEPGYLLDDIPF